jgi:quinol monooxygenase YgiN
MVIVVGIIEVEPDDRLRYLESKAGQVAATLAEAGCLDYSYAADARDPGRVRLLERWDTMADLQAHVDALRSAPVPAAPPVPSRMAEATVYEAVPAAAPWG